MDDSNGEGFINQDYVTNLGATLNNFRVGLVSVRLPAPAQHPRGSADALGVFLADNDLAQEPTFALVSPPAA